MVPVIIGNSGGVDVRVHEAIRWISGHSHQAPKFAINMLKERVLTEPPLAARFSLDFFKSSSMVWMNQGMDLGL